MMAAQILLWTAFAMLFYVYFGYPAVIRLRSALAPREKERALAAETPTVTVVIVACNEAKLIRGRLENLLHLDYPPDRLRVLVGSDGSTDATAALARSLDSPRVTVVAFTCQRGKAAVLNDLIPMTRSELVVLGDVRQRYDAGALRALARGFADPRTGAISGELVLLRGPHGAEIEGVDFYWRYEKFIRRHESRVNSTVGSTGAIYAIRRELFRPIPRSVILDDVLIPMQIVRRGYRVRFEPRARAYDRISPSAAIEFQRKLRTIAGNFQLFYLVPWLLDPFRNRLWLQTWSHKALRLLVPLWLAVSLVTNLFVLQLTAYRYLLVAQLLFYAAAAIGYLLRRARRRPSVLTVPYTFCLLNLATVIALFSLLQGRQRVTWKKAAR